jgi:hypothetical protein
MTNINYKQILTINYSDKQWNLFGNTYDGIEWLDESQQPTQDELESLWDVTQDTTLKIICSNKAKDLLSASDWSVLPDVGLQNFEDFVTYRKALRSLVLNPVADSVFPIQPTPIWK